ncbi:hypothetical protein U1Q18_041741 [Sarracenia purpurea var. burkii]
MGVESLNLGEEIQTLKATAAPKTRDSYTALLKLMENQAMELLHSLPATNGTPTSSQGLKGLFGIRSRWIWVRDDQGKDNKKVSSARMKMSRKATATTKGRGGGGMVPVKEGAAE